MTDVDLTFVADYNYEAKNEQELNYLAGDTITITTEQDGWYYGEHKATGKSGWVAPTFGHILQVSPYKDLSDDEKLKKRKDAYKKLLDIQHEFHSTLSSFIDSVVIPLNNRETPFKRSFLSDSAVAVSFSLLQELQKDCANFEQVLRNSTSDIEISNAYIQFAPSLQIYAQYAAENTRLLNAVKTNMKQLAPLIPSDIRLEMILLLPMQFYVTYKAELQEYLWLTPISQATYGSLEAALEALTVQTNIVDAKLKEEAESYELLNLQAKFSGNPTIFTPNRRIIKEGEIERLRVSTSSDLDGKTYYAHLFNDALIYSQRNMRGNFKLRHSIELKDAKVEVLRGVGGPGGMTITTKEDPDKPYQFRFINDNDMAEWMRLIKEQIDALKVRKKDRRMSNFAIAKTNLNLPGVELARLGKRCSAIYKFLLGELQFSEAMSAMNITVIQPLINASRGAALAAMKVSQFSSNGELEAATKEEMAAVQQTPLTKYQAQQVTEALKDPDVKIFLRAAEGITTATKEFATSLETVCTAGSWDESICIGSFFNSVSALSLYNQFQAYSEGQQAMLRILRTPLFSQFYKEAEAFLANNPGSLKDKIELPRKRVKHYFFFLTELQKFTPEDHEDLTPLMTSKDALDFMDKKIEELIKIKRNFEVLLEIQSSFVMCNDPVIAKLASMDRRFIKQGDLKKVCRRKPKTFRFWLFSDYLIYGSALPGGGNFSFNRSIDLQKLTVKAHQGVDIKNAFEIFGAEKSFVVIANSLTMQKEWIDAIQTTKDALLTSKGVDPTAASDEVESAPLWMPDSGSDVCELCQKGFSLFNRRHHCRKCGILVCGDHSKNKLILAHIHKTQKHRVCDNCYHNKDASSSTKNRSVSAAPAPVNQSISAAASPALSPSKPMGSRSSLPPPATSPLVENNFSPAVAARIQQQGGGGGEGAPSTAAPSIPKREPPKPPTSEPPAVPQKPATIGKLNVIKKDDADTASSPPTGQRRMPRRSRVAPPPPSTGTGAANAASAAASLLPIPENKPTAPPKAAKTPPPLPKSPVPKREVSPPKTAPPALPTKPSKGPPPLPSTAPPPVPGTAPPPVPSEAPPPLPSTVPPPLPNMAPPSVHNAAPTPDPVPNASSQIIPASKTASSPILGRAALKSPQPPDQPVVNSTQPNSPSPMQTVSNDSSPLPSSPSGPAVKPSPPKIVPPPPPPPPPKTPLRETAQDAAIDEAEEELADEHFKKFRKMKDMLPPGAVRQKMTAEGYAASDIDAFLEGKVNTLPAPNTAAGNPLAGLSAVKLNSPNITPSSPKPPSLLDQIQQGSKLKAVKEDDARMGQPKTLQGSGGLLGMLAMEMSKRRFNMKETDPDDDDSDSSGFSDSDSDFD